MKNAKRYGQVVNMPQMALTGLSESWLFKEIGDCHWHMLCSDLGLKSNEIFDEFENRLYATFIRIRVESTNPLRDFEENDPLDIEGNIHRIGNSLYLSQVAVSSSDKAIQSTLATTFSTREDSCSNHKLTKGVPSGSESTSINKISDIPTHILDYTRLKKRTIGQVPVGNHVFEITDDVIFDTIYKLNPYTDINGVGLLYFAAYPLINDYCELEFFSKRQKSGQHWALNSSTKMRDVFYFANCNIDDKIRYKLHDYKVLHDNQIAMCSSLWREKDDTLMARVFTVKQVDSHCDFWNPTV